MAGLVHLLCFCCSFFGPLLVYLHCCPLAPLSCLCAVFLSSHCCTFLGLVFSLFSLCCLVRVLVSHPVLFRHLSLPLSLFLSRSLVSPLAMVHPVILWLSEASRSKSCTKMPLSDYVAFSARIPPLPSGRRSVQSALFSDLMRAKNTGRSTPV